MTAPLNALFQALAPLWEPRLTAAYAAVVVALRLALALHWFNPAVWAAFLLMSRDIEAACDGPFQSARYGVFLGKRGKIVATGGVRYGIIEVLLNAAASLYRAARSGRKTRWNSA